MPQEQAYEGPQSGTRVSELAGTPEAQEALCTVIRDTAWTSLDDVRAIVALGGVTHPTEESLRTLWEASMRGHSSSPEGVASSTAALALGSVGSGMYSADDERYPSLRQDLSNAAFGASDAHEKATYVRALGNTGDPSLSREIVSLLDDEDAGVRSAVAQSLGSLGPSPVAGDLMRRLKQEKSGVVRSSIAEALVSWESPPPAAMESVRAAIRAEPDESARFNMARILAKNVETFPENGEVLQDLLRAEKSKRIRRHVAETLAAAENK